MTSTARPVSSRVCEFDIMYTNGISHEGDLIDLALVDKLVEKSGSWFNYGDKRLGQGRENAKVFLKDNPDVMKELTARVLAKRTGGDYSPPDGVKDDGDDDNEDE